MSSSEIKNESIIDQECQPEGVEWPSGWIIYVRDEGNVCCGECPICKVRFQDRILARKHDRLPHRPPKIILDDGCCSCWTHC